MKHALVSGAQGFIGRALAARLLADPALERLTLLDVAFDAPPADARVRQVSGSITEAEVRRAACATPVDAVFHLACIPGGAAEQDYERGRAINLDATLHLLEDLRGQPAPPRFVFASSVAVYGTRLPPRVDEQTLPQPGLSYGAHKLAAEVLVADASRRGWVQGCSLRLPGVVARPGDAAGMLSAFMSRLFWCLRDGLPITVPVSPEGAAWWISRGACVDNLLHAARVEPQLLDARRCYQMPVLCFTVGTLVDALARRFGAQRRALVTYAPDPCIEALFAAYPPLHTPRAEALGWRHDGTIEALIERAMAVEDERPA